MASSKKAKITSYTIPKNTTSERMEALLNFLELTPFQNAKLPLFFSNKDDSDQVKKYKIYINALMCKVVDENRFTGEYSSKNYINNLPSAVVYAIGKEHELINLKEEPHIVLQKFATCLEYCTFDLDGPGKVYDAHVDVIGDIDDIVFDILMREKDSLKVSVLNDIVKYFKPDYFLEYAQKYGIGDDVNLRSHEIMEKLINGEEIEDEDEDEESGEGLDEEADLLPYEPINQRVINLVGSEDGDYLESSEYED